MKEIQGDSVMKKTNSDGLPQKTIYNLDELTPTSRQVLELYPILAQCQGCNMCTESCPQDIDVLRYVAHAFCGEIAEAAKESFECVMCGICAAKCPAELPVHYIGLLCRRLYGRYETPRAQHLASRVSEIEEGKFDAELEELKRMGESELRSRYKELKIEL